MKKLNEKFLALADAVSFGMGTPTNIFFWVLAVLIWFGLGALRQDLFTHANFLPAWFTSPAWNFPLNTITTLAELYIGFLVAAATNRAERELRKIIMGMEANLQEIKKINENQDKILKLLVRDQNKEIVKEDEIIAAIKTPSK